MYDGSIRINTEIDTKSFEAQIKMAIKELEELEKEYQRYEEMSKKGFNYANRMDETAEKIEKAKNKLSDLIAKQNKLNETTNKIDFGKWSKQLLKVGVAMIGIRSAMGIISKASSTYLSQNEETAKKMQSIWTALGNLIGPIIEMIANGILKIVGYLNVFVKALTGGKIDLTKGMNNNSKAINGTAKSMEKLNKQMASFDEMNVLSDNSSASASGGGVSGGSFEMPELDERIVKKLQDMAKWLKENWDWISKVGIALGLVFGAVSVAKWLGGIKSLIGGAGVGLLGLAAALIWIYDIIKLQDLKKEWDELMEYNKALDETLEKLHEKYLLNLEDKKKEAEAYEKGSQEVAQYTGQLKSNIDMALSDMKTHSALSKEYQRAMEEIEANVEAYKQLYLQGKLTEEQTKTYRDVMAQLGYNMDGTKMSAVDYAKYLVEIGKETQNDSDKSKTLADSLINLARTPYRITVDTYFNEPDTSKLNNALNKMKNNLNVVFGSIGGSIKMAKGGIVNNPGRGVSFGNITTGEAGREWVQPLDDPASLQLIGETIGRYITINTQMNNYMNGRLISRELQKTQNDSDFAYNR